MRFSTLLPSVLCITLFASPLLAETPGSEKKTSPLTVERLAERTRPSVVVIRVGTRDGRGGGVGTGFVVDADGLIATNMHVIGQGRTITVETAEGKNLPVQSIHAYNRQLDLAVIRVKAKGLKPLPLGTARTLKDGQSVVAMGNPQGLKHSVVAGVVSGQRKFEGRTMIQVAIPIEPGNSGGPLMDRQGRVVGLLTIKSLVTRNLGFAVTVDSLKPLLARPNTVAYSAWQTIGALDPDLWEPKLGAYWRQRAGRILVEREGSGFGGRSFCLSKKKVPALPYEVGVMVKLDDESGAAGLIFHADGGDKHYGFYPSGGKLRLTRFAGPSVFSWKILRHEASPHYRPGEWNHLKVRLEKDRIHCYVNDHLLFTEADTTWTKGQAGLAKFRTTVAEFKKFQIARRLPPLAPPAALTKRVRNTLESLPFPPMAGTDRVLRGKTGQQVAGKLAPEGPATLKVLQTRARELERRARQLRALARVVHQRQVLAQLQEVIKGKDEDIDLIHATLLIAKLDNEELDVNSYRDQVKRLGRKVAATLDARATEQQKRKALNQFLFKRLGFHGSREDYYNRSNSYLSEVIDDREGLPLTLAILYMELAQQLGLKVQGVGLPGHFIARHVPSKGKPQLIDVYDGGKVLSKEDVVNMVLTIAGIRLREEQLDPVGKRDILIRMLHNLRNVAEREEDREGMLRYLDAIVVLDPEAVQERGMRAVLRYQAGDRDGALKDVDWLLERKPEGLNLDRVRAFRRMIIRPER